MSVVAVLLATLLFFYAFERSKLLAMSVAVIKEANGAAKSLRAPGLDDAARETIAQTMAVRLFSQFGRLVLLTALVCAAPVGLLALAVHAGMTDTAEIWGISTSWPFIAANILVFVAVLARGKGKV